METHAFQTIILTSLLVCYIHGLLLATCHIIGYFKCFYFIHALATSYGQCICPQAQRHAHTQNTHPHKRAWTFYVTRLAYCRWIPIALRVTCLMYMLTRLLNCSQKSKQVDVYRISCIGHGEIGVINLVFDFHPPFSYNCTHFLVILWCACTILPFWVK